MLEYSDPDESDDDGPMDPVDLPIPTENLAAVRQADQDLHPALLLRQQEEAEAEAERARELGAIEAEALDDARLSAVVYKDGKGGNTGAIEIQLDLDRDKIAKANEKARKRANYYTPEERTIRLNTHKTHLVALLSNAQQRNKCMNGDLLKARLLSLLPKKILTGFSKISPQNEPNRAKRGRLFERTVTDLVDWWVDEWQVDWLAGVRFRSFDEGDRLGLVLSAEREAVEASLSAEETDQSVSKKKKKNKKKKGEVGKASGGEMVRSSKSLQKKALMMSGSRDVCAQLFVGMCRSLGIGARLVTSLQPVPWRMAGGSGGGRKSMESTEPSEVDEDDEEDMEEVALPDTERPPSPILEPSASTPNNGFVRWADRAPNQRFPGLTNQLGVSAGQSPAQTLSGGPGEKIKPNALRILDKKRKGKGRKLKDKVQDPNAPFTVLSPPIFWAEVFSRPDQEWIPVDPVRGFLRRAKEFESLPGTGEGSRNKMLYVVGIEEDGSVKDLTPKYSSTFSDKTLKQRVPIVRSGRSTEDWWGDLVDRLGRGYKLQRDVVEDAKLEYSIKKKTGGMPATLSAFHNHPDYVLERHLKREEVVFPKIQHSLLRGEPVYKRSNVVQCKTTENWMRSGREVKENEIPMKWVKTRAVTINRRREVEAHKEEMGEELRQPLFSESQTRLWRAPPVVDGKILRNGFGNIDLFAPTMLPPGAVHLPYKGIAKVAKQLEISFAEACTGFEFKNRKAIPKLEGVVVAVENEEMLLEAYWIAAAEAEKKEQERQKARALKRWERLISGMRIRQRLVKEYGDKTPEISLGEKEGPKPVKIRPYKAKPSEPPKPIAVDFATNASQLVSPSSTTRTVTPERSTDDRSESESEGSDEEQPFARPDRPTRTLQPKSLNELLGATQSITRLEEDSDSGDDQDRPQAGEEPDVPIDQRSQPSPSARPDRPKPKPRIILRTNSAASTTRTRSKLKRTRAGHDEDGEEEEESSDGGPPVELLTRGKRAVRLVNAKPPQPVPSAMIPPAGGRTLRARGRKSAEELALEKERDRLEREAMGY